MSSVTHHSQSSASDVRREWLYVGLGLTTLMSVLAMIVALVALSDSTSSGAMNASGAGAKGSSMMAPAAAGGGATAVAAPAKQTAGSSVVGVTMGEMFLHLTANTAPAGKVTFNADNTGSVVHEMVVIRTDKPADKLGTGARVPETGAIGETGDVKVGEKKSVSFKMKPGHYALICNLPGHYASGMRADFTVN